MEPPEAWFDFFTECIYTAQKHKKHKAWRDGICTCSFVRGWVILKLYPEGASRSTEPLEEWRIPPSHPKTIAEQEIEFQVHLVQLSGSPQPLAGARHEHKGKLEDQENAAFLKPATSLQPCALAPSGVSSLPPKRRLPGGLFRSSKSSQHDFLKQAQLSVQPSGSGPDVSSEHGSRQLARAQSPCTIARPSAFVPPLLRLAEEPRVNSEPLPAELAWGVNAAVAALQSAFPCWGCSSSTQCCAPLVPMDEAACSADVFSALFMEAESCTLHQARQRDEATGALLVAPGTASHLRCDEHQSTKGHQALPEPTAAVPGHSSKGLQAASGPQNPCNITRTVAAPSQKYAAAGAVPNERLEETESGRTYSPRVSSAALTVGNSHFHVGRGPSDAGRGADRPPSSASKSRFFALAGGAVVRSAGASETKPPDAGPLEKGLPFPCIGERSEKAASSVVSGQARLFGATLLKAPAGVQTSVGHPTEQVVNPQHQHQHGQRESPVHREHTAQQQLERQRQQDEAQQLHRRERQAFEPPLEKGSGPGPPRQPRPLMLLEELPQNQIKKLADLVPVTFCTAEQGPLLFNAAYAAAGHLLQPAFGPKEALTAKQLALQYFNCTAISIQAALNEVAQNLSSSNGSRAGHKEARLFVDGAQLRADGKRLYGAQQRVAQAQLQRKMKQKQQRREHARRQRKKQRLAAEATSTSEEDADDSDGSGCDPEASEQVGLLLDLSKATVLQEFPLAGPKGSKATQQLGVPFEAAVTMKEHLGRNDIWALSADGRFDDWSKLVLVRSVWRGANPHSHCIKVSVIGPWSSFLDNLQIRLIAFTCSGQASRAALAPPPLLLQIRQLLQGGTRAVGKLRAAWLGRFHEDLASVEACERLLKAESAFYKVAREDNFPLKCPEAAAQELGDACAARIIGLGCCEAGAVESTAADAKLSQPIELCMGSDDAEKILRQSALAKGTCPLNHEQQQVLVGVSRWFRYLNDLCPFGLRESLHDFESGQERRSPCTESGSLSQRSEGPSESSSPCRPWCSKDAEGKGATVASPASKSPACHIRSPSGESESGALFDAEDDEVNVSPFSDVLGAMDVLDKEVTSPAGASVGGSRAPLRRSKSRSLPSSAAHEAPKPSSPSRPICPNPVEALHASEAVAQGCLREDRGAVLKACDPGPRSSQTQEGGSGCPLKDSTANSLTGPPHPAAATEPLASAAASMPACSAPVLLVQGVFGAGKSTLLAACLATLCRLLDTAKSRGRVLLVCLTNAAVDCVLLHLLQQFHCSDFARIGRLSEIHPALLPYAVSSSTSRDAAVREFKCVLSQLAGGSVWGPVASMAKELLKNINDGSFPPPLQRWKRRRIWATTCSAAASSDLFSGSGFHGVGSESPPGGRFPFLVMDEASQVGEPLAAAVLTRARPLRCLLLGDTRQLPPTTRLRGPMAAVTNSLFSRLLHHAASPNIASVQQSAAEPVEEKGSGKGKSEVLAPAGDTFFCLIQMRVQYRCHPDLGHLAGALFYGSYLLHGVTAAQRQPPVHSWGGALCCAIVRRGRESKVGQSFSNVPEALALAQLVRHALCGGAKTMHLPNRVEGCRETQPAPYQLAPQHVGIICFYRSQVEEVKRQLLLELPKGVVDLLQVSTVDAFQGSEKDLIFLSLVRTSGFQQAAGAQHQGTHASDFLSCPKRVCVALTRARRQLVVVGAETAFTQHRVWACVRSRAAKLYM